MDSTTGFGSHRRAVWWFIQAAWGACWGILIASALAPWLAELSLGSGSETVYYNGIAPPRAVQLAEKTEHCWVFTLYLLAPLCALAALAMRTPLPAGALLLACVLQCPLLTAAMRPKHPECRYLWLLASLAALLYPLWLRSRRAAVADPGKAGEAGPAKLETAAPHRLRLGPACLGVAAVCGVCAALILPISTDALYGMLAGELHLGSFIFGPTLYYRQPGLVPGLDFESHYGIGPAYLFSFFAGQGAREFITHYLWFFMTIVTFFFVSGFLVLSAFFRSHRAGFTCVLLLMFFTLEGNHFVWPSNWPIRFPFLFLFLWLAAKETLWGKTWPAVFATGCCAALTLFWQTDVGLYFAAAGAASYGARALWGKQSWLCVPGFLLSLALSFLVFTFALFGSRAFSLEFLKRLLEPLMHYSTGFGGTPIAWTHGWRYVHNLAGFIFACATLGWALWQFRTCRGQSLPVAARFLFPCAAIGLMMIYKWVNRSIDAVWSYNAAALLIVIFFWMRRNVLAAEEWLVARGGIAWSLPGRKRMVRFALVLLLLFVGRFAGVFERKSAEPSSPLLRFTKYYHQLPTLANACLGAPPGKSSDLPVHPDDLDFLRAATRPEERVALLAPFDWLYLMEVGRTPYFHYVHVTHTHSHELLSRVVAQLDRADRVFVDIDYLPKLAEFNPVVHAEVTPRLRADFEPVSASHRLMLLRRKSSSAALVHVDAR